MWPLLALSAAFLWALSNVWDRRLISSTAVHWEALVGVASLSLFGISFLLSLFLGGTFRWEYGAPALMEVGILWLFMAFYYFALLSGKVEETAPLLSLSAVFTLAFDLARGVSLTSINILGVLLAVVGGMIIAWRGKPVGVAFALIAAIVVAVRNVLPLAFSLSLEDFIFTYSVLGLLLSLPLAFLHKDERAFAFIKPNLLNGVAFSLFVLSLINGSAALSTALSQLSALFIIPIAHLLYKSPPSFFITKIAGALLLALGAALCIL